MEQKTLNMCLLLALIVLGMGLYIVNYSHVFYDKDFNGFKCNMMMEQRMGCYKGCQFATQPTLGITNINDADKRIELYDKCSVACVQLYDIDFDFSEDIRSCEYGDFNV